MSFFSLWFLPTLVSVLVESQRVIRDCGSDQCVNIKECPKWRSRIAEVGSVISGLTVNQRNEFSKSICGFQAKEPLVCCVSQDVNILSFNNRQPQSRLPLKEADEEPCGVIVETAERVANGENSAGPGAWPWIARLIYEGNSIQPKATFCSGSLVTQRHVLTAGHCARTEGLGEPVEVVLGELDLTNEYDCLVTEDNCGGNGTEGRQCYEDVYCADSAKRYKVKEITISPNFNSEGGIHPRTFVINDIAVIELTEHVLFTGFIQPICLPSPGEKDNSGTRMALAGWGNIAEGRRPVVSAAILQELDKLIEIPLEDSEAEDGFGCKTLLDLDLRDNQMCLSREEGSKGNSCRGDSGGPVARLRRTNRGRWELAGIISFGFGHCGSRSPLVATRMEDQSILDWVKEVIGRKELPSNRTKGIPHEDLVW